MNAILPLAPLSFAGCARSATLLQHRPLVARLARRMRQRLPGNVTLEELMQAGMLGLDQAVTGFQEGHGAQFDTYATQRIQGAMLDELRANDEHSRHARARIRKIKTAVQQLENELGRPPRHTEIAEKLGLPLQEVHDTLVESSTRSVPFGASDYDVAENEASHQEAANSDDTFFTAENADPSAALQRRQEHGAVNDAFSLLDEKARSLLWMLYRDDLSRLEVASRLGVTESRVCQLHACAVKQLKLLVGIDLATTVPSKCKVEKPRKYAVLAGANKATRAGQAYEH